MPGFPLRILSAAAAAALLAGAAPRLAADLVDLPGDEAARALQARGTVHSEAAALVLHTRMSSAEIHPAPDRDLAIGRALFARGRDAAPAAAAAFVRGLERAPADGRAWAEYAEALVAAFGRSGDAADALDMSWRRAPHDPAARRIRDALVR